jgi:hypothetical protein
MPVFLEKFIPWPVSSLDIVSWRVILTSVYPRKKYITGLLCSMFHQMAGIILKMTEAFQKSIERMQQTMKGTLALHPSYLSLVHNQSIPMGHTSIVFGWNI